MKTPATEFTMPQSALIALCRADPSGARVFSDADVSVLAWEHDRSKFSLVGYNYPDSNKVLALLMGARGLVAKGYVEKVGLRRYRLTPAGVALGRRLVESSSSSAEVPVSRRIRSVSVPSDIDAYLSCALSSRAFTLYGAGMKAQIEVSDAKNFWGETRGANCSDTLVASEKFNNCLILARDYFVGDSLRLEGGREVSQAELDKLRDISLWLHSKFSGELLRKARRGTEV